jgi:hypothetical protein
MSPAYIFRHADQLLIELESPDEHGWDGDGHVVWSDICYPEEVDALLAGTEGENSSSFNDDYEDDLDMWKLKTRMNFEKENTRFVIRMYMLVMSCIT